MEHAPTSAAIGTRIADARLTAGVNRTLAAATILVSEETLRRYEGGSSDISLRQAVELADLYGVSVDAFVVAATEVPA